MLVHLDLNVAIKNDYIIILDTDKTNKYVVVDQDTYLKMGAKHISKDAIITQQEVEVIQGDANRHLSMWIKIWAWGRLGGRDQGSGSPSSRRSAWVHP